MRKLLLALGFLAFASPALAALSSSSMGNAAYTATSTDVRIVPTVALTANRTLTLPYAGATCIGSGCANSLEIIDSQGNIGGANSCLVIAPASGDTINGSTSSITFCSTFGRVILRPLTGTNWQLDAYGPGAIQGTTTNDNAQAGYVGEIITSSFCAGTGSTQAVTITIAAPAVITDTGHSIIGACPVVFTTSGALPTGITASTTYWVVPSSVTANTYQIATTVANALAGTSITTTGSQSGTQTRTSGSTLSTGAAANITGITLTAGDWDCRALVARNLGASTSVTQLQGSISPTTATMSADGSALSNYFATAANVMASGTDSVIGAARVALSATTNEYLVAKDTFTVSTDTGFGNIACRRMR